MKPILFNTEMVRAILYGRKSVTRRVVKFRPGWNTTWSGYIPDGPVLYGSNNRPAAKAPYRTGDILYVRETWQFAYDMDGNDQPVDGTGRYLYYADDPVPFNDWIMPDGTHRDYMPWRPSIHMPKEAARLFLRVTNVRVERLKDMTADSAMDEGFTDWNDAKRVWNKTIKRKELLRYGWDANPLVWVIEFERISKEEALKDA